jgi:hypothetical protein
MILSGEGRKPALDEKLWMGEEAMTAPGIAADGGGL